VSASLSIQDVFTPAKQADWMQRLITNAQALGLNASAWQSGSVARTILAVVSFAFQLVDVNTSIIAQGGFLDFAATGSISYVDANGETAVVPVTPEGGPGWLDILVDSLYNVRRIEETSAGGAEAITNTSVSTYGPFTAGTYHVTDPNNKQTYSNTASLTVPPSSVVGTSVSAAASYFGAIQITTSSHHGLSSGAIVSLQGVTGIPPLANATAWRVQVLDLSNFVLTGSVFSGTYSGGGTVYAPTVATMKADVPGSVGNSLDATGAPNVNTVTQPVTSLVGVSVSNVDVFLGTDTESNADLAARARLKLQSLSTGGPKGAYQFFALSSQLLATSLVPPLAVGSAITRVRTVTDPSSGTVYVFVANPAGPSSPDDVAATDAVIQAYAVPEAVTAQVIAATAKTVSVVATVFLRQGYVNAANQLLFETAVQDYFSTLPIGGDSDPAGAYTNIVPLEGVIGSIFDTAEKNSIQIQNVVLTMNGVAGDLPLIILPGLLLAQVAVLAPAVPQITLESVGA